jgi:hypothetical protein
LHGISLHCTALHVVAQHFTSLQAIALRCVGKPFDLRPCVLFLPPRDDNP